MKMLYGAVVEQILGKHLRHVIAFDQGYHIFTEN